jgi:serine/threonine-protein kinase RsbW
VAEGPLLLQLRNDTAELEAGQKTLRAFLEAEGVSTRALYHAELAFEELVTNIIRHGFGFRDRGMHRIDVNASVDGEEIVLTVEDAAPPFDPSQAPQPDLPTGIDDARIGGLGLRLVRMAAKRMDYERVGDRNRVTVAIART